MTEEEKKAIILLNDFKEGKIERDKLEHYSKGGFKLGYFYTLDIQKSIDIILNLLEKQQKEIYNLKNQTQIISPIYVKENYIPKETIREKIEYYKHKDFIKMQVVMRHDNEALKIVDVLKELLGE